MINNYYKPTPKKWRKIGDAILFLSASISAFIPTSPLDEGSKLWAMFGLNIFGIIGKTATNFFKEEDESEKSAN
jgi:hypothetical protein